MCVFFKGDEGLSVGGCVLEEKEKRGTERDISIGGRFGGERKGEGDREVEMQGKEFILSVSQ